MSKIRFVMLMMMILSFLYCDAQNSGYIDGSHSSNVESFWGKLVNKARYLWNVKTSVDPTEGTKSIYDSQLVTIDVRQGAEINGSFIGEATSRSSSCAIASVPCSCASATGTCACASTGCTCTVAPCTFGGAASGSSSSSSSSSSGSSSSSSSSSSSGSSSSSSSSLSISKVCKGTTATPPCECYTTTCVNGVCGAAVTSVNPSSACTTFLG